MIGKTRQSYDLAVGPARGVLRPGTAFEGLMKHTSTALAPWVAHYWTVNWDLRGCAPQVVETVPHPNVHLVFEGTGATVSGVYTTKFTKMLEGESGVYGVKFLPGKRSLQRLFNEYVAASPQWVIRRYRLHEAIERLHAGVVDVAALAAELGYFDQAHLVQDFKSIVGGTPGHYQLSLVTKPARASSSLQGRAR